jgi:hypothetical protein
VKKCLLIQPGAFGDILVCAPIAKIYYDNGYKVYWPTTLKYKSLIDRLPYAEHIMLDDRSIHPDWLRSDVQKALEILDNKEIDVILNLADRGPHPMANRNDENFEECKYRLSNIPINYKHTLSWSRDLKKEDALYSKIVNGSEEYVFCHLESSRGDKAALPDSINEKIIEAKELEGYSIYDWYKVIVNANKIFCVESAFHQFIDGFINDIKDKPKYILSRSTLDKGDTYTYSPYWDKKYV